MTKKAPIPRYMPLQRKLWISAFFLISFLIVSLTVYFYKSSSRELHHQLSERHNNHISDIATIVDHSADIFNNIYQNLSATNNFREEKIENSGDLLNRHKEVLEYDFSHFMSNWGVDEAFILDVSNEIFFSITRESVITSNTNDLDKYNNPSIKRVALAQGPITTALPESTSISWIDKESLSQSPHVFIICKTACRQFITVALNHNGKTAGHFIASRPMSYMANDFHQINDAFLGILQPSITTSIAQTSFRNTDDDTTNNLNNQSWEMSVTQHWTDALNPEIIQFISTSEKNSTASINVVEVAGKYYSTSAVPLSKTLTEPLRYLIVEDITAIRSNIVNTTIQTVVLAISLLSIVLAYFIFNMHRYNRRIKQQANVLPLVGDKQFHEARELIYNTRQKSLYRDESDTVDDLVTSLTYQFESLDKAVNIRTREMERLSLFDPLTGLANRNLFLYELQSDLDRFTEQDGMLAAIMIDLDNFKRLNDSLGHQHGDMLLGKIGLRLKNATRNLGMVARLGGDEFAIILRGAKDFYLLEKICRKIVLLTSRAIDLDTHSIVINCSLGVALATRNQSANDLIKNAEIAMYDAKSRGGNTFSVFSSAMAKEAHDSLTLESDIRRAFEQNEFTLYLQPKVTMDNVIQGFEALVRWDHPERGILLPMEFIPAMESMGIINQLDDFVLDASCRQLKSLQAHYPNISIAVNISSMHFTESKFLVYLKSCLDKYPIDPGKIELEITETLLMENMNTGMEIMKQIKEMGVGIAIDDFGTGYSSLSYLKRLPVDTIKIDREFIKDIPDSERDMQISSVIIFLAKQLNFKVVAEGVETREQSVFLKANQCDLAQGFLFSRPMPAHKALLLLESQGGSIHLSNSQSDIQHPTLENSFFNIEKDKKMIKQSTPKASNHQSHENFIKHKESIDQLIDPSLETRH